MILTLLSDFGHHDHFVGVAKGILLQQLPHLQMIDISHEVIPFQLLECSYFMQSAYPHFGKNTLHLSLFDIMCTRPASLLIMEHEGQYFLSSDNGLLPLTFPKRADSVYAAGFEADSYIEWMKKTASFLRNWEKDGFSVGHLRKVEPLKRPVSLAPFVNGDTLECHVLHIDKYGNVVINLKKDEFEQFSKGRNFNIEFSRTESISRISRDYSSVSEGQRLCRFNSGGFLEIAVRNGSAAELFDLSVPREKQLFYRKIKISFS